jgi:thiol-disulfide isomerase/thioredoxin
MRKTISTMLVCATVLAIAPSAMGLGIGDPAPALKVKEWVKGDPIDLEKDKGKIIVVEFWATWCGPCIASIPHLTALQGMMGDAGVRVIGLTSEDPNNSLDTVKRFVEDQGSKMGYTVAYDQGRETYEKFMGGVGAGGIPTAFIIDREGKLAWFGHPADPQMHSLLEEMTKGSYDPVASRIKMKKVQRYKALLNELKDYGGAQKLIDELIQLDPDKKDLYEADRFHCLVMNRKTRSTAADRGSEIVERINNAHTLAEMAWRMMAEEEGYQGKYDALALRAAEKAYGLDKEDWTVLRSLAYARFLHGNVSSAIELQQKAIAGANESDHAELKRDLEFFESNK